MRTLSSNAEAHSFFEPAPAHPIAVMHVLDSLNIGGAERVAVNLANLLPRDQYEAHLCTTHGDGPLARLVAKDVHRVRLERKYRFDSVAVHNLVQYVRDHNIQILHAHGTSLFFTRWVSFFCGSGVAIVWHDHYGRSELNDRPEWLYRLATYRIGGIIAVSESLAEWSRQSLSLSPQRIWYIKNLIEVPADYGLIPKLPGALGRRVVCVANFRPQKDHMTLLRAMAIVGRQVPDAHLLLVGDSADPDYVEFIRRQISALQLDRTVTYMGPRQDVTAILAGSDVAVLSSISEGLPLALLEYGGAGLPVVATRVGQCAEVLDEGRAGILIPPASPELLAAALLLLLGSPENRIRFGMQLRERVLSQYGSAAIMQQVCAIYEFLLGKPRKVNESVRPAGRPLFEEDGSRSPTSSPRTI